MPVGLEVRVPAEAVSPAEAREYLVDFLTWVHEFFHGIVEESGPYGTYSDIFVGDQSAYFSEALAEIERDGMFDTASAALRSLPTKVIMNHGLYGTQLKLKLSNVNHWLRRFVQNPSRKALAWLADVIDAVLDSVLDGVPGGGAIIEFKEAMRGAIEQDF